MEIFEQSLKVTPDDLDELEHVNNVRYVQWIQDISKNHWLAVAPQELQQKVIWVVVNHNITYRNAAKLGDHILLKTYIRSCSGVLSERVVEMQLESSGELLVQSVTKWCMLDQTSQRPTRISPEIKSLFL